MKTDLEMKTYGLISLAGAASNDVKQRASLQRYLDSGDADDVLADLGETRELFINGVDALAKLLTRNRDLFGR